MKLRHLAFTALLASPVVAQEAKLPAESISSHYESVAKHLELGGVFYGYADVDSDIKDLTTMVDSILDSLRKNEDSIPEKLTAAGIMNELGFDAIKAIGASSRKKGDLFHNRAFIAMPGGSAGIMKMLGGKPAPFTSATLAPAGADLVLEQDLNLGVVLDIVTNIVKQTGSEEAQAEMDDALEQPMGQLPMTVGEFIKKLNTKITFFASLDEGKKLNLKDFPEPVPFINGVIAVDNMGWLFAELVKMVADSDEFEHQTGEGFEIIRPTKPLPPELDGYKPVLYHDKKSGRIMIATTPEFLATCMEGKTPLSGDEGYKQAIDGLPLEGNGLQYVSSDALKLVWTVLKAAAKDTPDAQMDVAMKIWEMYLPKGNNAIASVRANLPGGLLVASNSSDTHKSTLATASIYPIAMIAGIAAPMQARKMQMEMQQRQFELEREIEPDEETERPRNAPKKPVEAPAEKISSNLQQITFAAEAYFIDNPKEKSVNYAGLIKGGFILEIDPVDGESYKELTLTRNGGKLSVKTKSGETIKHDYSAVTD